MRVRRYPALFALVAALAACGGGGSGGSPGPVQIAPGAAPAPTPSPASTPTSGCSVRARQDWAATQLREWYLFPELLATGVDQAAHGTVQGYVDALVAPARAQSRDRYFTYLTSIAEENAFYNSGSSAGLGVRLSYDSVNRRLFVSEAFEGTPGLAAGLDRGTEIVAIGTTEGNLRSVEAIFAAEGAGGVSAALGPSDVGVTRTLRVISGGAERVVTVTKADYAIQPVSSRYGARVIEDGGRRVGYLNLRTFIDTADPQLRSAFANFRAQGITEIVVDFRYNGGGLVSIAELMGDLIGGNRNGQVFSHTTYRPEKSGNNKTERFSSQSQSIAATRVAFIGTGGTASASELVINAFTPYLGQSMALVGTNTYGKPVGQIALDRASCDDRLRVVAFRTENANRQGDYYTGLAGAVPVTCRAGDDLTRPLGDPQEASLRGALDFLAGRSCTPISGENQGTQSAGGRRLLQTLGESTAQREVPGLY